MLVLTGIYVQLSHENNFLSIVNTSIVTTHQVNITTYIKLMISLSLALIKDTANDSVSFNALVVWTIGKLLKKDKFLYTFENSSLRG